MRILAITALFACMSIAHAGDVAVDRMIDCPDSIGHDPSIVTKQAVRPGGDCHTSYRFNYALIDTRFGVVYWLGVPSSFVLTVDIDEPEQEDSVENLTACRTIYGDGALIDEWMVPSGESCKGRTEFSSAYRRYTPKSVCLMPHTECVDIADLKPLAQERARAVLESINGEYASRSGIR